MDRFNFLPQGLRRNNPATAPADSTATTAIGAAAGTATGTAGTDPNTNINGQPAPLPAVYNPNLSQNQNQNQNQRAQNPYTYPDSVSSLSSDDEYTDDDMYEDDEVYSVSSRSSDTVPLSPRSRQQRGQPQYPSSSTLNHQNRAQNHNGHSQNQNQSLNDQEDLYCDLEAQLGIHPALRVPHPGPQNIPANFPAPPPIPQSQEEMAEIERRSSSRFFLPRMSFRFLGVGGGGNRPRPASSHYSGDGLPPATEVNFPSSQYPASPKSPAFNYTIGEQQLPSTRLHVPGVERTWSRGSNGPPTRDGTRDGSAGGGARVGGEAGRGERQGASRYGFGLLGGAGTRGASRSREGRTVRVTEPRRVHTSSHTGHGARRHRSERDGERRRDGTGRSRSGRSGSGSGHHSRSHRSRRDPGTTTTTSRRHRDVRDDERRKRRKHKKSTSSRRHEGHSRSATTAAGERERDRDREHRRKKRAHAHASSPSVSSPPKHFLFCFPWVKSRTKRALILRSFVSGLFLACLLIVFLALTLSHTISAQEFTISMILVVILGAIVFLHSVVRLIMLAFKGGRNHSHTHKHKHHNDLESGQAHVHHHVLGNGNGPAPYGDIHAAGPQGPYAIPPTPIRVVLARDEEAAGLPSEAAAGVVKPPEYGQWRESVRVDPNRIYWMRNEAVTPELPPAVPPALLPSEHDQEAAGAGPGFGSGFGSEEGAAAQSRSRAGSGDSNGSNPGLGRGTGTLRRPPSYSSDDGVSYVVEAQPRSIAPVSDVPVATGGVGSGRAGRRLA
ncbi:hypothetical protein B0T09DRAFT_158786 [Sordaria sp. MPI-SDFR-AT-0083]|nr:hypothetical protein B0T09DRAFT_158786 [Sordaria sp. MPI-SDFR-AT-0083]